MIEKRTTAEDATCFPFGLLFRQRRSVDDETASISSQTALLPPSGQKRPSRSLRSAAVDVIAPILSRNEDRSMPSHVSNRQSPMPRNRQEMAQRPPSFPSPNFVGRSDSRSVPGPQLPPLQTMSGRPAFNGPNVPSVYLPPLEPQAMPTGSVKAPIRSIPVSQLLSNSPPSPKRQTWAPPPNPALKTPVWGQGSSPEEPARMQPPAYVVSNGHRLDQPPAFGRHPASHPPHPFSFLQPEHSARKSESVEAHHHYSPAAMSMSQSPAPSYYESHSEPSPRSVLPPSPNFPKVSQVPPLVYTLHIRQQPCAARACGFGERDRRVIDPPPILELKITDRKTGAPTQDPYGMLALHCTLLSPQADSDETQVPPTCAEMQSTRRLMGTLVASPYPAKDEHGVAGTFFVFPDLSCRSPGDFRLHFKLLRIDPMNMQQGAIHGTVASAVTDIFKVYTAKDFPGMQASSALLKSLRRQGLNVGVKKGSEARKGKGVKPKKGGDMSDLSEEESDESDQERRGSAYTAGSASGSTGGFSPKTKPKKNKRPRMAF